MIVLLNVLESVAQDSQNKLDDKLVTQLIGFSVEEMKKSENNQSVQGVLSNILIALGSNHCNEVSVFISVLIVVHYELSGSNVLVHVLSRYISTAICSSLSFPPRTFYSI